MRFLWPWPFCRKWSLFWDSRRPRSSSSETPSNSVKMYSLFYTSKSKQRSLSLFRKLKHILRKRLLKNLWCSPTKSFFLCVFFFVLTSGVICGIFSVKTMENSAGKKLQLMKSWDAGKLNSCGDPENWNPREPLDWTIWIPSCGLLVPEITRDRKSNGNRSVKEIHINSS